nr:PAS domain-containing protein [Polyangiaceae bacterium]
MSAPVVAPGALAIPGLLESIVEHIPAMVFLKEAAELRFVLFNRAGEELLGFDRDHLRGKNDYDVFPKEQADFFTRKDREVLAGGRLVYIEEPITTAHGERWLLTRKIPIAGEGGLPRYLLGVSIDITERRAYEEALDANARLREALGALLSLEGVAAAGALASHTAARIVSALAGDDPASGAWEARALAAALAKLGAPDPRPAPESLDLTEALAAWTQRPDAR